MDPSSILSLAYDITKNLYAYYCVWKDCDKDVSDLRVQLLWLHNVFKKLRDIDRDHRLSANDTSLVYDALGRCNDVANELRNILDKIKKEGTPKDVLDKLMAWARKGCYPFKKSTVVVVGAHVQDCLEELHMAMDLLNLDITNKSFDKLAEMDAKLVEGFATTGAALETLPAIELAVAAISDQTSSVKADTDAIKSIQLSEQERIEMVAVLDWLCAADYSQQQADFLARRQTGTGTWFLESFEYKAWTQGARRILVCPGQPGAGKTIMAATVIDHLVRTQDATGVTVIYLFCNYKRRDEQVTTHILGAFIRQLVYSNKHVPASLKEMYDYHKTRDIQRPSQEVLHKALSLLVQEFTTVYIVIDALDECQQVVRTNVLLALQNTQLLDRVRLMVTMRPIPAILEDLPADLSLEIRATDSDVAAYAKARMMELSNCIRQSRDLQEATITAIVSSVKGMFLLAQLHLDSLKSKRTVKAVKAALDRLLQSSDVNVYSKAYTEAMERIKMQDAEDVALAVEALSWIVRAQRPLSALELQHALAIETDPEVADLDEENLPPMDEIVSLCAGLVIKDEQSDVIRLVHYTAQKFFEQNWAHLLPDAESNIALKCLKYLSFQAFMTGACSSEKEMEDRLAHHPLLEYCVKHWAFHVSPCCMDAAYPSVQDSALRFLREERLVVAATQAILHFQPTYRYGGLLYGTAYLEWTQGTHLVAYLGAEKLMAFLLQADNSMDCRSGIGRTPLSYAAEGGHEKMVQLLLNTGRVDVNSKDEETGFTPLGQAMYWEHKTIVRLLLDTGQLDINIKDKYDRTPLFYAVYEGDESTVRLLMATGQADFDAKDVCDWTPLIYAFEYRIKGEEPSEMFVKRLIDSTEIDLNAKSDDGRTLLMYMAKCGYETVVRTLIHQAKVDCEDNSGWTALTYAAAYGHDVIVRILIDLLDADSKDSQGRTPLSHAAENGYDTTVKLLIGLVNADSKGNNDRTPLSYAAEKGHDKVVKLLVGLMDADSADDEGRTPLSYAAESGTNATIKLLIDLDADVNSEDMCGQTPLSYATDRVYGRGETVDLNDYLNVDTRHGRIPLDSAGEDLRDAMGKLLEKASADT